jgi:hypothetical protein
LKTIKKFGIEKNEKEYFFFIFKTEEKNEKDA